MAGTENRSFQSVKKLEKKNAKQFVVLTETHNGFKYIRMNSAMAYVLLIYLGRIFDPTGCQQVKGEDDMAKNFRVCTKESGKDCLALQLFGDFDASSACELIHVLKERAKKNGKVAIETDGLKTINTFGLDVFLQRMSLLNNTRTNVEVTGRFGGLFLEE